MVSSCSDHRFGVELCVLRPFRHSLIVEMRGGGLKSRIGLQELRGRRKR